MIEKNNRKETRILKSNESWNEKRMILEREEGENERIEKEFIEEKLKQSVTEAFALPDTKDDIDDDGNDILSKNNQMNNTLDHEKDKDEDNDADDNDNNTVYNGNNMLIPKQFVSIDEAYITYKHNIRHQSFPRWNVSSSIEMDECGILENNDSILSSPMIIDMMIQFVNESSIRYQEIIDTGYDAYDGREITNTTLLDHKDDMVGWYPEILFILDIKR
jgi:hypothetical protein